MHSVDEDRNVMQVSVIESLKCSVDPVQKCNNGVRETGKEILNEHTRTMGCEQHSALQPTPTHEKEIGMERRAQQQKPASLALPHYITLNSLRKRRKYHDCWGSQVNRLSTKKVSQPSDASRRKLCDVVRSRQDSLDIVVTQGR